MNFSVVIPCFNEEASIGALLEVLSRHCTAEHIVIADDRSTDYTLGVVEEWSRKDERIIVSPAPPRSGQLAGWIRASSMVRADVVVCIDADSRPMAGAVEKLVEAITPAVPIVSGRVEPVGPTAAIRFSSAAFHQVRLANHVRETIIGRFFAADRAWFLKSAQRADIIANDTYLSCLAARSGCRGRYVPDAVIYYAGPSNPRDFSAQRQRADLGYRQLRAMKLLVREDEPSAAELLSVVAKLAVDDPGGAIAWASNVLRARTVGASRARASTAGTGIWDAQPSTKRGV